MDYFRMESAAGTLNPVTNRLIYGAALYLHFHFYSALQRKMQCDKLQATVNWCTECFPIKCPYLQHINL